MTTWHQNMHPSNIVYRYDWFRIAGLSVRPSLQPISLPFLDPLGKQIGPWVTLFLLERNQCRKLISAQLVHQDKSVSTFSSNHFAGEVFFPLPCASKPWTRSELHRCHLPNWSACLWVHPGPPRHRSQSSEFGLTCHPRVVVSLVILGKSTSFWWAFPACCLLDVGPNHPSLSPQMLPLSPPIFFQKKSAACMFFYLWLTADSVLAPIHSASAP